MVAVLSKSEDTVAAQVIGLVRCATTMHTVQLHATALNIDYLIKNLACVHSY